MKTVKAPIESLLPLIEESFQNKQDITFLVKGTSMNPTFKDNETVVTLKQFSKPLKKRHIYLYKVSDTILLHRYLKTKNGIHIFRGDNCSSYEYVNIDSIIGHVIMVDNKPFKPTFKRTYALHVKHIKQFIKNCIRG